MMIEAFQQGDKRIVKLTGRLDAMTATAPETALNASPEGVRMLEMDFSVREYLPSAGLRVLPAAQKRMAKQGGLTLSHVGGAVLEIF